MNASVAKRVAATLESTQARIRATRWGALTLDPERNKATPLAELVDRLAVGAQLDALASTAAAVASAQLDSFPENVFWDFDHYLASVHGRASCYEDYASELAVTTRATVRLMHLYGQRSRIRFRYVHDFMYGFDWARWVRRDRQQRSGLGAFDPAFLRHSEDRGRRILELIERDDHWYPRLDDGVARNPFPFARDPEHELALYRDLASRKLIPVEAWRIDAVPDCSRDYDALRESRAQVLGLRRHPQGDDPGEHQ